MSSTVLTVLICWLVFQLVISIGYMTSVIDFKYDTACCIVLIPVFLVLWTPIRFFNTIFHGGRYTWNYNNDGKFWRWFNSEELKEMKVGRKVRKDAYLKKYERQIKGNFIVYIEKEKADDEYEIIEKSEELPYKDALKLYKKWCKGCKKYYTDYKLYKIRRTKDYPTKYIKFVSVEDFSED